VDEGEDKHCPGDPAVEYLELFVEDAGLDSDPVDFG
jgi:hypothetical protein